MSKKILITGAKGFLGSNVSKYFKSLGYETYGIGHGGLHMLSEKKISNLQLKILKLSKFGLHKLLQKQLKSKTWEDYLKMSEKK